MPRVEWSFLLPAEDHKQLKWLMAYLRSRLTPWGQIIMPGLFISLAIASVGVEISAYLLPSFILAYLITVYILSFFFRPTAEVYRAFSAVPHAGGFYTYKVVVRNTGKNVIRGVSVFEQCLPHGIYPEIDHPQADNTADWLDPGEQTSLTLVFRIPRRGVFELLPLVAGSHFPAGIYRAVRRTGQKARFIVYPRILRHSGLSVDLHQILQTGGTAESMKAGISNEFFTTREYQEGDRLRDIHWPSTARSGKLIVREYIEEYFHRIGLFVDTELGRFEKHRSFETRISLCAGVAEDLYIKNTAVDLLISGEDRPHLPAGPGVTPFHLLLERLAAIEGDAKVDFNAAAAAAEPVARHLSLMMLFLKDWDGKRRDFVRHIRETGCPVKTVIVRDKPTTIPVEKENIVVYTSPDLLRSP